MVYVKKLLIVLLILLMAGAGFYFWLDSKRKAMGELVKPMIEDIIKHDWDVNTVWEYVSPEFKFWYMKHGNPSIFNQFKRAGQFESFGETLRLEEQQEHDQKTATLYLVTHYQYNSYVMQLKLVSRKEQWLIYHFSLHPYEEDEAQEAISEEQGNE